MENCCCIHDMDGRCRMGARLSCGAVVDGECPFHGEAAQQALYCGSFRLPDAHDGEVTASWEDVKAKGEAIVASGGVSIIDETPTEVHSTVLSDVVRGQYGPHGRIRVDLGGPYDVTLSKRSWENHQNVGGWIQGYLCSCFVPGTKVLMAGGSKKAIELIRDGEEVIAPSGASRPVKALSRVYSGRLMCISTGKRDLRCTPEHPLWVRTSPAVTKWLFAGDVAEGMMLCVTDALTCSWERVTSVDSFGYSGLVHNLSVEVDETYIAEGVKVHNCQWGQYNSGQPGPRWQGRFCVTPETQVTLSDGSTCRIDEVRPGEHVRTFEGYGVVEQTMSRPFHGTMLKMHVEGHRNPLCITDNHPVLTVREGGREYVDAGLLEPGMPVYVDSCGKNERAVLSKVDRFRFDGRVYNLKVRSDENYFAEGVCVHNCSHAYATLLVSNQRARKEFTRDHTASRKDGSQMTDEELFYDITDAMFNDDAEALEAVASVDRGTVDAMCDQMTFRRANANEGVVCWRGLSRKVSLRTDTRTATRKFNYTEKRALEDEIEGKKLRNSDRIKPSLMLDDDSLFL